jgi:hypothetical protein
MALLDAALAAHAAGLCVVPPREDGSKAPDGMWARWQRERPTEADLCQWYAGGRRGVGLVCGRVSGNLEMFEWEEDARFREFYARARLLGLGDLVERVVNGYFEVTPRRGYHTFYRCREVEGNVELARRPKRREEMKHPQDKVKVLIETRGERGYAVVAPSCGSVHPTGRPYVLRCGGFASIETVSPEERSDLLDLARSMDEMPRVAPPARRCASGPSGDRPGDYFNAVASWAEVLEPHGWRYQGRAPDGNEHWCRPGKNRGTSATVHLDRGDALFVFSSSTLFDPGRTVTKFGAYAELNHGGDFATAAREVGRDPRVVAARVGHLAPAVAR